MNFSHKSHGRHCFLRSFKTTCPNCGEDVLYWECTHGCKVFFEYPPYGKLIKHVCRKKRKNQKKKITNIVKSPKGLLKNPNTYCPACGKAFTSEKSLQDHINELKKCDYYHQIIRNDKKTKPNSNKENKKPQEDDFKPIFGKIRFRNRKKP